MASIGTLGDNFSNGVNPCLWTAPTGGAIGTTATATVPTTWTPSPSVFGVTVPGSVVMPVLTCEASSSGSNPVGVSSVDTYDLTGSGIWFEFVSFTGSGGSWSSYVSIGNNDGTFWFEFTGTDTLRANDPGGSNNAIGSFTAASNVFLRIREDSGSVYYDTSPDSVNWTNATSYTYSIDITAMTVSIYSSGSGSGAATLSVANLNPVF